MRFIKTRLTRRRRFMRFIETRVTRPDDSCDSSRLVCLEFHDSCDSWRLAWLVLKSHAIHDDSLDSLQTIQAIQRKTKSQKPSLFSTHNMRKPQELKELVDLSFLAWLELCCQTQMFLKAALPFSSCWFDLAEEEKRFHLMNFSPSHLQSVFCKRNLCVEICRVDFFFSRCNNNRE